MSYAYYSIKETVFNYRGVSHLIEGFFAIDQITGEIRLEQSVSDFVGGVFHILLESADSTDESAHRSRSSVQIYVYSESDVVCLNMPYNPMEMNINQIERIKQSISNLTNFNVKVKDVLYHIIDGQVVNDVTDLKLVFLNKSTFDIITAERALTEVDRHRSMMGNVIPTMTKAQVSSPPHYYDLPPILMVFGVFSVLLIIVLVVLGLSMCYYRSKFRIEKRLYEDEVIITSALHRPPDRSLINESIDVLHKHTTRGLNYYAIQEKKLVVGAEDERRK